MSMMALMLGGRASPKQYSISYVIIGGGGSGTSASGGGAGGYRSSWNNEPSGGGATAEAPIIATRGTVYVAVVGAAGNDSSFGGITSLKGAPANSYSPDGTYGSGAGMQGNMSGGSPGTTGQGYRGGYPGSGCYCPSGAGGAGAVGGNAGNPYGGVGVASTITGTNIYRAGGGGGAIDTCYGYAQGLGGNGGGGDGAPAYSNGVSGTPNTGGGGGGSAVNAPCNAFYGPGAGGSGVVIIRMPTVHYSGIYTGTPIITTVGSDTILTFNGSGSYTG